MKRPVSRAVAYRQAQLAKYQSPQLRAVLQFEAGEFAAIEGMSVEELREFLRAEAEAVGLTLPAAEGRLEEVKQLKRLKQLN